MSGGDPFGERGHVLGRHRIEGYGGGGFRFAGMSHQGSILASPTGVRALGLDSFARFDEDALSKILGEAGAVDVLIIGTGARLLPLPASLRARLRGMGIGCETMATGAAVRTYNVLLDEDRRVAAALIAV